MIRTTIIKDLQVTAATNTEVETYSCPSTNYYLHVSLSEEKTETDKNDIALAKSSDGGIVEIAFTSSPGKSATPINIIYQI